MKSKTKVANLMYSIFSMDAIYYAVHCEMSDDVRYAMKHQGKRYLYPSELSEKEFLRIVSSEKVPPTYDVEHFKRFREGVDKLRASDKRVRDKYEGLTETEHFAVRHFYYYNVYR